VCRVLRAMGDNGHVGFLIAVDPGLMRGADTPVGRIALIVL